MHGMQWGQSDSEIISDLRNATHAATVRLHARSCQLNEALFRIAVAAGFEDKGGRVDASPSEIVERVEALLVEMVVKP